jgi:hypothetical protein
MATGTRVTLTLIGMAMAIALLGPLVLAQERASPVVPSTESAGPTASPAPASGSVGPDVTVAPPTSTPWIQPFVETDPAKGLQWPSASVVFEADDLRITARGKTFKGVISAEFIQSWAGESDRDYDVMWLEHGREMRMDIDLKSDGSDYWISKWMVYDGKEENPGWVTFKGPLFKTPLDEPMEADVRLAMGKGQDKLELRVDGMRIHAFHPGSGPAPLTGCQPPEPLDADAIAAEQLADYRATFSDEEWARYLESGDPRVQRKGLTLEEALLADFRRQVVMNPVVRAPRAFDGVPFAPGELRLEDWDEPEHQFKDTGIWTMPLADVETLLRDSGVCFEFSYSFVDQRQGNAGSIAGERWCTAPPRGELVSLEYREDVVDVEVWESAVQAPRDMPPAGWNCPTN